ncbi:hypothetical protein TSOC_013988, partial [Tetrabaena socialis]
NLYSLATTPTPTRRGSGNFSNTAPAGSLAGYTRNAAGGPPGSGPSLAGTGYGLGSAGQRATATTAATGSPAAVGLSSTMPAGSRPGTATRPGGAGAGAGGAAGRSGASVLGLSFSVGSNQSMGSRAYQEDYRAIADTTSTPGLGHLHNVLLGAAVYDGHGGKQVSHWLCSSYCLLNRCMEAVQQLVAGGGSPNEVSLVLEDVFVACGSTAISGRMTAGSCVALALLVQAGGVPWVLSANVGDSRTVVVSWDEEGGGGRPEGAQMSIDHKLGPAKLSEETRRVQVLFSFVWDVTVLGHKPGLVSMMGSALVAAGVLFVALTGAPPPGGSGSGEGAVAAGEGSGGGREEAARGWGKRDRHGEGGGWGRDQGGDASAVVSAVACGREADDRREAAAAASKAAAEASGNPARWAPPPAAAGAADQGPVGGNSGGGDGSEPGRSRSRWQRSSPEGDARVEPAAAEAGVEAAAGGSGGQRQEAGRDGGGDDMEVDGGREAAGGGGRGGSGGCGSTFLVLEAGAEAKAKAEAEAGDVRREHCEAGGRQRRQQQVAEAEAVYGVGET